MKNEITQQKPFFEILTTTLYSWKRLKNYLVTGLPDWYSHLSYLYPGFLPLSPVTKRTFSPKKTYAHATLEAAFLALMTTVKSTMLNRRQYAAFLIFCSSIWVFALHLPFDRHAKVEALGFLTNWFHLLNLISPYLWFLVILVGISFLIPPTGGTVKVFKRSAKVQFNRMMAVPLGICIAKIIWLCLIKSNEDFWSVPNWLYFTVGICIAYFFYRLLEYFAWRKFHAFDGIVASLEGLYKTEGIDSDVRKKLADPLWKDLREFHSKY
jgi:hypothetical protein